MCVDAAWLHLNQSLVLRPAASDSTPCQRFDRAPAVRPGAAASISSVYRLAQRTVGVRLVNRVRRTWVLAPTYITAAMR